METQNIEWVSTHTVDVDGAKFSRSWTMKPIDARQPSEMTLNEQMNAADDHAASEADQVRAQREEIAEEVWATYCEQAGDWHHTAKVHVITAGLYRVTVSPTYSDTVVCEAIVTNSIDYVH